MLERTVVSTESGSASVMELHEMNKDSCFIKVNVNNNSLIIDLYHSIYNCICCVCIAPLGLIQRRSSICITFFVVIIIVIIIVVIIVVRALEVIL